jgi:hypothetical protein
MEGKNVNGLSSNRRVISDQRVFIVTEEGKKIK